MNDYSKIRIAKVYTKLEFKKKYHYLFRKSKQFQEMREWKVIKLFYTISCLITEYGVILLYIILRRTIRKFYRVNIFGSAFHFDEPPRGNYIVFNKIEIFFLAFKIQYFSNCCFLLFSNSICSQ